MPRKKALSKQVVVIGGGTYGLGRAIAKGAAARGAQVVVGARTPEALAGTLADIEAAGSEGLRARDRRRRSRAGREPGARCGRTVRADRHICRERNGHGVRRGPPARGGRAAPGVRRQLLRRRLRLLVGAASPARVAGHVHPDRLGALVQGHPAAGRLLLVEGRAAHLLRERTRRAGRRSGRASPSPSILPGAINTPQFDRARQKLGYQPQPVPPIYEPEPFADAVLHCCEHPVRELPVSWGAQKLLWGQKLSPRAGDLVLLRTGWSGQHTGERKPVDSPDNLFEPIPGDPGTHGRFDEQARSSTAWTWLRLHRREVRGGPGIGYHGGATSWPPRPLFI